MGLRAGYKGIKKVGRGLSLSTDGILSSTGGGPGGETALSDLSDVSIISPSDGQVLQYDATSQKWVNHKNVSEYISVTVDVYSAASDTVSFADRTGTKTVTTDVSGHGTATIVCINEDSITFTSSVAKNPSNLSADYSKTVNITSSTTDVYVMPDNVCYWFGYKSSEYEVVSTANGWGQEGQHFASPTEYTNYVYIKAQSGAEYGCGFGYSSKKQGNILKCVVEGVNNVSDQYGNIVSNSAKVIDNFGERIMTAITSGSKSVVSIDISSVTSSYLFAYASNGRGSNIYALWYE